MAILNSIMTWRMKKRFHQIELFIKYPIEVQKECLKNLLDEAKNTEWGKKHDFKNIKSYEDFKQKLPLQNYDSIKDDVLRIKNGEKNVMWPHEIKWFAKSSGTTSEKSKFIPVSYDSLHDCHYKGGKDLLSIYCSQVNDTQIFTGKCFTTGGSNQILNDHNGNYQGDLSAIIIDNLPLWVQFFRAPEKEIALMENWEHKIERMAQSAIKENVTSISGVPSWTLVLFNRILEITGAKNIKEVWPNLELYMHGGVSFKPFEKNYQEIIPDVNLLETYNASEGFFGIQYQLNQPGFLLMLDYGIFYEFIEVSNYQEGHYEKTIALEDVEIGVNYALVITTNAGLWRYVIGDTIAFISKAPFLIKITGRTKHFINAFGEELIIENADKAIEIACEKTNAIVHEYTAGPVYFAENKSGAHEWLIEFDQNPEDLDFFKNTLDNALKALNSDYEAKRFNNMVLNEPLVQKVKKGTFYAWLKDKGKIGGQHKVPRLANHRNYVEQIKQFNS